MIVIVSQSPRERGAFVALCESRKWPCIECDSVRAFVRLQRKTRPSIVLTRHRLGDGYCDEIISALPRRTSRRTRVIVLIQADTAAREEARQVAAGADYVHRDPIRSEVVLEYMAKFRADMKAQVSGAPFRGAVSFAFAGATVDAAERTVRHGRRSAHLTPRELELVELLREFSGSVVTYGTMYSEILERTFRGETSNMRVLLRKLDATFRRVGLALRRHVAVIPKLGYRYEPTPRS